MMIILLGDSSVELGKIGQRCLLGDATSHALEPLQRSGCLRLGIDGLLAQVGGVLLQLVVLHLRCIVPRILKIGLGGLEIQLGHSQVVAGGFRLARQGIGSKALLLEVARQITDSGVQGASRRHLPTLAEIGQCLSESLGLPRRIGRLAQTILSSSQSTLGAAVAFRTHVHLEQGRLLQTPALLLVVAFADVVALTTGSGFRVEVLRAIAVLAMADAEKLSILNGSAELEAHIRSHLPLVHFANIVRIVRADTAWGHVVGTRGPGEPVSEHTP
mmetsp:Transcript_66244/g.176737  ORF Transcript_66244/g.176737 Transcript_66244/m.176737 type:complete len:273 (+) Transcript_66244:375-1193(+)